MKTQTSKLSKVLAVVLMVVMLASVAMPIASAYEVDNYADEQISLQWLAPEATNIFPDVPNRPNWQNDPVSWAYRNNITSGVGGGRFNPSGRLSREMFATFLHRVAGTPSAAAANFPDQGSINGWATPAVNWASSIDVIGGFPDGTFGPQRSIQRQQIAAMLFRYAQHLNLDTTAPAGALAGFADSARVPGWATEGMRWAVHNGLITGMNGLLAPTNNATRAQTVAMLQRFVETFNIPTPGGGNVTNAVIIDHPDVLVTYHGTEMRNINRVNRQNIVFSVQNRSSTRLQLQGGVLAIDGVGLGRPAGGGRVEPNSTELIAFRTSYAVDAFPTMNPTTISGRLEVFRVPEGQSATRIVNQTFINVRVGEGTVPTPPTGTGAQIYNDEYVRVTFLRTELTGHNDRQNLVFFVENRTNATLTFQTNGAFAINGTGIGWGRGSDPVAAQSSGIVRFSWDPDTFPTMNPTTVSGGLSVIDFCRLLVPSNQIDSGLVRFTFSNVNVR